MGKGTVYVVSAPSGGGKTSLVNKLVNEFDNIELSISYTTRKPRAGEVDGEHYHFIDKHNFEKKIRNNEFLEYEQIFDNLYGTPQKEVEDLINKGIDVIFDIDWKGARNITNHFAKSCSIFIVPPTIEILKQRLIARDPMANSTDIQKRLEEAKNDIQHYAEYDFLVINDDFKRAYEDIKSILIANRLSLKNQIAKKHQIIENLLQ
jgi:guanylate kinase